MPFLDVWIHLIWSTKNRARVLIKEKREPLFAHIRENCKSKSIYLDIVNGHIDHVHTLVSLRGDQSIAKIAQLMKGESAHWANQQQLFRPRLEWQDEYIAISINPSEKNRVREYIRAQEAHHEIRSFMDEFASVMRDQRLYRADGG